MLPEEPGPIRLYAVVPVEEASSLKARRSFSILSCGPVAALCGRPPEQGDRARAAFWHDRVVGLAVERCSAVVPFRLGMDFGSAAELRATVRLNAAQLAEQLGRFRGRVEMGLKARIPDPTADRPLHLPSGLDRIRALAPDPADRWERLGRSPQGNIFEGCYLVPRPAVEAFWLAVEDIRRFAPELPLLGSGPWAPYSFCDTPLQQGPTLVAGTPPQRVGADPPQKAGIPESHSSVGCTAITNELHSPDARGGTSLERPWQSFDERNHS